MDPYTWLIYSTLRSNYISMLISHFHPPWSFSSKWYPSWVLHRLSSTIMVLEMGYLFVAFSTLLKTYRNFFHLFLFSIYKDKEALSKVLVIFISHVKQALFSPVPQHLIYFNRLTNSHLYLYDVGRCSTPFVVSLSGFSSSTF